jgi:hypothetical protein
MRESRPDLVRGRHFRDEAIVLCVRCYFGSVAPSTFDMGNIARTCKNSGVEQNKEGSADSVMPIP